MGDRRTPIRVLLCDDAEGFRALMRVTLADDPSIEVVGEAADGAEGVQATADLQPDVVLLDMSMPRMGGLQAIPEMRRHGASIIGLSSLSATRMRGPSIEIGAHSYLEKGTELDEIRQAIHGAADEALATGGQPKVTPNRSHSTGIDAKSNSRP